jgi:hypothetical protein
MLLEYAKKVMEISDNNDKKLIENSFIKLTGDPTTDNLARKNFYFSSSPDFEVAKKNF